MKPILFAGARNLSGYGFDTETETSSPLPVIISDHASHGLTYKSEMSLWKPSEQDISNIIAGGVIGLVFCRFDNGGFGFRVEVACVEGL